MNELDPSEIHNLKCAAINNLQALHTSILPLEMTALKLEEDKTGPHPLRSQESIPLFIEFHMDANFLWSAAVTVLIIARSHGDEKAKQALAAMGMDEKEKDDFVKANGMRLAAERALKVLVPEMTLKVFRHGERS
jgi:hypothetical protein